MFVDFKIISESGYDAGLPIEKKVSKYNFNEYHKTNYELIDGYDYYKLIHI